jgi:hypothetical protein
MVVAAVLAGVAAAAVAAWSVTSDEERGRPAGGVRLSFEPGPSHSVGLVEHSGLFRRAVAGINEEINLPQDLTIKVVGDSAAARVGVTGPEYVPRERTVYFPWAFVADADRDLSQVRGASADEVDRIANSRTRLGERQKDRLLQDALLFVLYHEVSHGLFDVLDVPVVTSEEDTADSLAATFAIAHGSGGIASAGAALALLRGERRGTPSLADYADDHGLDQERAFNALCLVYGSSPARYSELVGGPGNLTPRRARVCRFDYERTLRSWRRLLGRWLTEEGGLLPLKG